MEKSEVLIGKTALVTGASRGLGAALAWDLASRAADLVLIARSERRLLRLAHVLRSKFGIRVGTIALDLSKPESLRELSSQLQNERIDLLINNAAHLQACYFEQMASQDISTLLGLNVAAPTQLIQQFLPGMMRRNYGRILNVSSAASLIGLPGLALYSATRSALNTLSEGLRRELAGCDVRVTILIPGILRSPSTVGPLASSEELYQVSPFASFSRLSRRRVARKAVDALIQGRRVVNLTGWALGLRLSVNRLLPRYVDSRFARLFRPRERLSLPGVKPATILVAGATGFVGRRLIPELIRSGYGVRALVRTPSKLGLVPAEAEVFCGDTLDSERLQRAMEGIEIAYYLVHSMGARRFEDLDRQSAISFRTAALAARVRQVIYLGALRTTGTPSRHLKSRYEIEAILSQPPLTSTILRGGLIIGPGSSTQSMLTDVLLRLPFVAYTRLMTTRVQPIAIADVTRYLVQCATEPTTWNAQFDIGGPEVVSYLDLFKMIDSLLGTNRRMIELPGRHLRTASWFVSLLTGIDRRAARTLFESIGCEMICHESRIQEVFPGRLLTVQESLAAD